ncbi:MAG: hypothetical protein AAGA54_12895 [Myxococcota bacterium]
MDKDQVLAAQKTWGDGIVAIGAAFTNKGDYVARAREHIDTLYAYGDGREVLFKPTKCEHIQFRPTLTGALSYFVGSSDSIPGFPEDKGFAIAPYTAVRFENAGIIINGDRALAMGNYFFTSPDGTETKVEYTFGYVMIDGAVRIELHHSALPFKN